MTNMQHLHTQTKRFYHRNINNRQSKQPQIGKLHSFAVRKRDTTRLFHYKYKLITGAEP